MSARKMAIKVADQINTISKSLSAVRMAKCGVKFNDHTLGMKVEVDKSNADLVYVKATNVPDSLTMEVFVPHFNLLWYKYMLTKNEVGGDIFSQLVLCRLYVVLARYQVRACGTRSAELRKRVPVT